MNTGMHVSLSRLFYFWFCEVWILNAQMQVFVLCFWYLSCLVFSELPRPVVQCILIWKNSQSLWLQILLLILSVSFLSGIQGVHLKVKAEKVEFIINIFSANQNLQSFKAHFLQLGKPALLLTQWPTFKMNRENNVFFDVFWHYSRKACYAFQDNKDSQFSVIINTAFQYFFYFVTV